MAGERWTQQDDTLTCESGVFRMVVKKVNGFLRFMVFRRTAECDVPQELLGSGTADNPRAAMLSAQRMAHQFDR